MALKVFIDSDVIISSLISPTGAAFFLLHQTDILELYLSNLSVKELKAVAGRLDIDERQLNRLIQKRCTVVQLHGSKNDIKTKFTKYVLDVNDAHIVAGAAEAKVQFLISYNIKHFKADKLKDDLSILLTTPADFLQYLRSI